MEPRIIKQCEEAMYDAIWLELDRDPQRPAVARVDIKTKAGDISVWCDRTGNTAVVSHKNNNNDSERLEEAIEGCVNYQDVMDDWLEDQPIRRPRPDGRLRGKQARQPYGSTGLTTKC
jgi:hypothetical protein